MSQSIWTTPAMCVAIVRCSSSTVTERRSLMLCSAWVAASKVSTGAAVTVSVIVRKSGPPGGGAGLRSNELKLPTFWARKRSRSESLRSRRLDPLPAAGRHVEAVRRRAAELDGERSGAGGEPDRLEGRPRLHVDGRGRGGGGQLRPDRLGELARPDRVGVREPDRLELDPVDGAPVDLDREIQRGPGRRGHVPPAPEVLRLVAREGERDRGGAPRGASVGPGAQAQPRQLARGDARERGARGA